MTDGLKTMPDGFDAMEDSLTRSRSIIESLRAELAKYRGMEVELAAVKNDMEGFRLSWRKHLEAIEESARKLMPGEPCHEGKCADCVDDRALLDAIHAALAAFDQGENNG